MYVKYEITNKGTKLKLSAKERKVVSHRIHIADAGIMATHFLDFIENVSKGYYGICFIFFLENLRRTSVCAGQIELASNTKIQNCLDNNSKRMKINTE